MKGQKYYGRTLIAFLSIMMCTFLPPSQANSSGNNKNLSIRVIGLKSNNGQLIISVFKNQEQFRTEKPIKSYTVKKSKVKSGSISTNISLPPGTYGIALLDDENSNSKMDYRGPLPLEGFGFGDYYHRGLTRPSFSDFSFSLQSDKRIGIRVRYL